MPRSGVYVDVCTSPRWDGAVLTSVDLDLDVIRDRSGRVWVDDEDEFARHRVSLGYPGAIVDQATRTCSAVLCVLQAGEPPFDGDTAGHWGGVLAAFTANRR